MNKGYLLSVEQMRDKIGKPIYWLMCDASGVPDCDEVFVDEIDYFYVGQHGVGVSTGPYDGHIGIYNGEGELTDGGVRRLYFAKENAEAALKGAKTINASLGADAYAIVKEHIGGPELCVVKGTISRIEDGHISIEKVESALSSRVFKFPFSEWGRWVHPTEDAAVKALDEIKNQIL